MILVHPPISKPCEPPIGIARLAGALSANQIGHYVIDANIEGIHWLLKKIPDKKDRWTRRAVQNLSGNLLSLKKGLLFRDIDKYKKAIFEINHLLGVSALSNDVKITLTDYKNKSLSPLSSSDLHYSAIHFKENPFYEYFEERLAPLIEKCGDNTIGISLNYLSQAICAFALIGFLRRRFAVSRIILGGGLVTSWMSGRGSINPFDDMVDHIVSGPGEAPLLTLLDKKISCNGFSYKPIYDAFPLNDYLSFGLIIPYNTSTGCYWGRCSFCPERAEGNPYIQKPVNKVVSEIKDIIKDKTPALLHITDNAISPAVLKAFIKEPPGVPWYGFTRVTEELTDLNFCMDIKRSGCVMLKLGVESGDQSVLDYMHKGIDIAMTASALKNLNKTGIATYVYILFGTPTESLASARQTMSFISANHNAIDYISVAIFNLPVNSHETKGLKLREFYGGDLSLYTDFVHPEGWGRLKIRQFIDKEFKRHPAIKPILQRQPPLFTSNHAPFFVMQQGKVS